MKSPKRTFNRRYTAALSAALALGLTLAACGGSGGSGSQASSGGSGSGPVQITYATGGATPPNEMEAAIFSPQLQKAGVLKGYGKDYTFKLLTASKGTPQTLSLLSAGQVDMGTLGFSTIALGAEKKSVKGGFSVVAAQFVDGHPGYGSNAYMVLKSSGINSARDLVGKTVGTNQIGSASDIILRAWLKNHGVDPKSGSVRFAETGYSSQGAALNSGRTALGTFVQPFEAVEGATGKAKILFSTPQATGETAAIAVVARNDFLKAHTAAVKSFLADWVRGLDWLLDPKNKAKALQIMSKITGTPEKTLALFYGVKGKDYYRDPNACPSASALQNGINAMHKVGDLPTVVQVKPLINTSYLPKPCTP